MKAPPSGRRTTRGAEAGSTSSPRAPRRHVAASGLGNQAMQSAGLRRQVQARGNLDLRDVHATAERGTTGASRQLPFAMEIQRSFGHHDISAVRAYVGGPAGNAAAAMGGVDGYAFGNAVAFSEQPDLELAVHEAAHVVQQRAGVRLPDGASRRGDAYERHADAVADRVARGESAEALLDALAGAGGSSGPVVQRYHGEDESLSPETTASMSDDELRETSSGTLSALAERRDEGAVENRELVRYEMARRGIEQPPPVAPARQVTIAGLIWSDDATYVRWMIEQLFSGQLGRSPQDARDEVDAYLQRIREEAGYSPVAGVPESVPERQPEIDFVTSVRDQIDTQLGVVQAELDAFIAEFSVGARVLGLQILDESERRIEHELERYGIESELVTVWRSDYDGLAHSSYMDVETRWSFGGGPDAAQQRQAMMSAAGEIAASERRLRTLRERRTLVADQLRLAESCTAPVCDPDDASDMDADIDGEGVAPTLFSLCQFATPELVGSADQLRDLLGSVDRSLAHLDQEHALLRADKEGEFPVIAAYTSGETIDLAGLDRLATAPSAAAIGEDAHEKLANIARVREELGDDLSIFELPQLLEMAKARYFVAPGSPRANAIQAEVDDIADASMWRSIAIAVISIGLGILAAIPTGGASLAVTGTVLAAEVAGLALDAYLLYQSVQDYELRSALTDTDFDRARVLSHDEPSLFWLAVDIVGTTVGLAGAMRAFREAARVRRAFVLARNVDEAAEQLAELRRLRDTGAITAEAAQRLEREMLRDISDPAIAAALGRGAAEAARPADEVAAAMGRALSDVVTPEDVARLSDELGLQVVTRAELDDAVRVLFDVVDHRIARPRMVAIGASATVGDVLAHRETVVLLRRMEAATAGLDRSFDDLIGTVVDSGGHLNPFPAGSEAFNAWMELRKYPELIQQRLARLGADGVSRSERELLREQVSFFETELATHAHTVQRAVLERGEDFIARAARSNEAAFAAGCPREIVLPDGSRFPIGQPGSQYYYAVGGPDGFVLRRYVDAVDAPAMSLRRTAAGVWELYEGELSRTEAALALVRSWPEPDQEAFRNAVAAAAGLDPRARVVPLAGIHPTNTTIGSLLDADTSRRLRAALVRSLSRNRTPAEARRIAREAMQSLRSHPIVVVRGTDQLRVYGYRRSFAASLPGGGPQVIEGDLHHWIPLYLGGDHRLANLYDLDRQAHREIHEILESVTFVDDITLDPNSIGRLDVDFERGVGILMPDGSIRLESLATYSVSTQ